MWRRLAGGLLSGPRPALASAKVFGGVRALASSPVLRSHHITDALLIKIYGQDHPGITARFSEMLAEAGSEFYDVDQVVVHENLSLYFLVGMPSSGEQESNFIRSVLDKSKRENVQVDFEVVHRDDVISASAARIPQGLVVTLLKTELGFKEIAAVARTASDAGFNISKIRRLSTLQHLGSGLTSAVEVLVDPVGAAALPVAQASDRRVMLREQLMALRDQLGCDVALQRETLLRRSKRLVVLDMDSTLIQQEVIDELARVAGKYDEVAEVTETAMRGEMDFDESLRQRCLHLKGLTDDVFQKVYEDQIQLTPGAERFVQVLQRLGYHVAIISGGFQQIADKVKADLGLDFAFANRLEVKDGVLTGRVTGAIVNRQRKRDLLESLCQTMRLVSEQVVAVGDGANDLDMLTHAGLGIAFNAKPIVQQQAHHAVNAARLDTVLYMMGISDSDVEALETETSNTLALP
jgi:phosphoserine phosphatase